jgi:UDP-glucuronate decarboxylase
MHFSQPDIQTILERSARSLTQLQGKHIVFAGAGGFLGRYFLEVFRQHNLNSTIKIRVLGLDNFASSTAAPDSDLFQSDEFISFRLADVCAPIDFSDIEPPDHIINAGGIASPHYYRAKPLATIDVSTIGSRNLLNWAHDCGAKYSFFSSSEIYGDPDPKAVPISEDYRGNVSTLGPRACYDESKRLGETLCYVYSENFGVHTNIIRPFNVYGPGMMKYDYRVMPNFARQIIAGEPLTVYGDGSQTRTFCYITDAMTGFLDVLAFGNRGEAYNVGTSEPEINIQSLASIFRNAWTGSPSSTVNSSYPNTYPGDEPIRRCPKINKLKALNDYEPLVSLEEGVTRYLDWAKKVF